MAQLARLNRIQPDVAPRPSAFSAHLVSDDELKPAGALPLARFNAVAWKTEAVAELAECDCWRRADIRGFAMRDFPGCPGIGLHFDDELAHGVT